MQTLLLFIGSFIVSRIMANYNSDRINTAIAESGYKVKYSRIFEYLKKNKVLSLLAIFATIIPVLNILTQIKTACNLNINMEKHLKLYDLMGALIPMTEEEKKKYSEEPTLKNFRNICFDSDVLFTPIKTIPVTNGKEEGYIYYKGIEDNYDFKIIRVPKFMKDDSEEKILKIIYLFSYPQEVRFKKWPHLYVKEIQETVLKELVTKKEALENKEETSKQEEAVLDNNENLLSVDEILKLIDEKISKLKDYNSRVNNPKIDESINKLENYLENNLNDNEEPKEELPKSPYSKR